MSRVVSIMQPYFAPYGGYWRLLAGADLFVIYDDVQFLRRGWMHRNRLPDRTGEAQWLTLPLKPAPQEALISEMIFADDATALMAERLRPFPGLEGLSGGAADYLNAGLFEGAFIDYLERQLTFARDLFGFRCEMVRSSRLAIDPALRGQDRILAVLERVGATDYVNAPGGRALYDEAAFAAQGVVLRFLPDWQGSYWSLLQRLASEDTAAIRADILAQTPAV
jgi:hypothetical protein